MKVTIKKCHKGDNKQHLESIEALLERMKVETREQCVSKLRYSLQFMSANSLRAVVSKLPNIIFGAEFSISGEVQVMNIYNGLVLLEIDSLIGVEEASAVRDMVAGYPQTFAAMVGSSGKSVKFLVRFTRPDGSLPQTPEEAQLFHEHAYRMAAQYYQGQLDYKLTLKEPLLNRSCRFSFDPDLYYEPQALPMILKQPASRLVVVEAKPQKPSMEERLMKVMPGCNKDNVYALLFENALMATINETGSDWREDMDALFVKVANSCFKAGLPQEWVVKGLVNHFECKPREMEVRMMVSNIYQITKGFGEKSCLSAEQLMAMRTDDFMKRRYELRYNTQLCEVEYRERNSFAFHFQSVTNRVMNSMALNALSEGLQLWDRDVKRYVYSDRVNSFSPVEDFLDNLPEWDGLDRIGQMSDCVPNNNEGWKDSFHRWFLCMVAHWQGVDKNHANSTSPLLIGAQGYRKSTFCRSLVPPQLRAYYTDSIDFSRKRDAELFLNRFALINIDEFDQISTAQQGFLKHILQKPVVNLRKPNQSSVEELRRYASFIGTSNHQDLLTDTSGSRRFICIKVTAPIEIMYPIDYNQLYAQAVHEIEKGERYWFSLEEEQQMAAKNNEFEQVSTSEQLFLQYFRAPQAGEAGEHLLAAEIYGRLQKRSSFKLSPTKMMHFGRILSKLGIPSKRMSSGYCYHVVEC